MKLMLLQMLPGPVHPCNVSMMGTRSVDPEERRRVAEIGIEVVDMRVLDEQGGLAPVGGFSQSSEQDQRPTARSGRARAYCPADDRSRRKPIRPASVGSGDNNILSNWV